ncbi:hypothetical protein GCM10010306_004930 [Streptomyces umbrinus]|nr:hypothetical protein GCM10010306_004930 [Streptomyces umbrinus]
MRTVMPASLASSSIRYSRLSATPEAYVVPSVTFPSPDPYPSVWSCSTLPLRQYSLAEWVASYAAMEASG